MVDYEEDESMILVSERRKQSKAIDKEEEALSYSFI